MEKKPPNNTTAPTGNIAPFGLRMLPDLREKIIEAARSSGRSMNAEIIHRLESSFVHESAVSDVVITAEQARAVAIASQGRLLESAKSECLKIIKDAASRGVNRADFDWQDYAGMSEEIDLKWDSEIQSNYVVPLVDYLVGLGYKVDLSMEHLFIDF